MKSLSWAVLRPYAIAVVGTLVALSVRLALDPMLGDRQPFFAFMTNIVLLAWLVGPRPAALAFALGLPLAAFFFLEPRYTIMVAETPNHLALFTYLVIGSGIVALGYTLRRAQDDADKSKQALDSQEQHVRVERKRLQKQLDQLSDELRGMDKSRECLLSLLEDELRRPLLPIASATSFLSIASTASEVESAMDIVRRETTQLGSLIEELLEVFRNSQRHIELRRERVDLAKVLGQAVHAMHSQVAQTGRELTVSVARDPLPIDGDPERLERVIHNLLVNAVRCTTPGGHIWIFGKRQDNTAVIEVRDTGIGLSEDAITGLFEPFGSGNQGRPRGVFRIGLMAVKQIVEMHGGTISVRSSGPGEGSEFTVRFPLAECVAPEREVVPQSPVASGRRSAN